MADNERCVLGEEIKSVVREIEKITTQLQVDNAKLETHFEDIADDLKRLVESTSKIQSDLYDKTEKHGILIAELKRSQEEHLKNHSKNVVVVSVLIACVTPIVILIKSMIGYLKVK